MRKEDRPTWRQKLFTYRVFLKPFLCIFPIFIAIGIFNYFQLSKKERYSTANPELRAVPNVSLPDTHGKLLRLSEIKEPGIIVFWASWCGPCVDELKQLETYDLGAWSYTAINSADKHADAVKFLEKEKIKKPRILFDDGGAINDIRSYPTVYVSFGDGHWGGPLLHGRFEEVIKEAKNMLAKRDYQPLQESPERLSQFRENAYWQFYYSVAGIFGPLYFLVLLFMLRREVQRTRFLRIALVIFILLSVLEDTRIIRLGLMFGMNGFWSNLWRYVYYSPLFWGGFIGIGILIYLKQFIPDIHKVPSE